MTTQMHAVPMMQSVKRRIVIEEVPSGTVGESGMSIRFEGFPEGWGLVNEVLLKASGQAAYQAVLEERKKHQHHNRPYIVVPGERV